MIEIGIVAESKTVNWRLINTEIIRQAAKILTAKKTLTASFCPVCLTTPLYDPISKKEPSATRKTKGI